MRNLAVLFLVFLMIGGIFGCDRVNSVVAPEVVGDPDGIGYPPRIIERSHIYESDQLHILLPLRPGEVDMVKVVGQLADEAGNPEVVLLTVKNGSLINRNPDWFDAGAVELGVKRFFLIPENQVQFIDFYWTSPSYSLEQHIKEFHGLPAPAIVGTEISVTGSLEILFESSRDVMMFRGLETRTRIADVSGLVGIETEYTQWAVSSNGLGNEWHVTFGEHYSPGTSTVILSHVLMTEIGDFEVQGEEIDIPYGGISNPYSLIEPYETYNLPHPALVQ